MDVVDQEIHFQEEILMEILGRLPMRSLLQFKCVSKYWKALTSDPYFTMKHLNHAKSDRDSKKLIIHQRCPKDGISSMYCCSLSLVQLVENVQKLDCPSASKPRRCAVYCSCSGLVIICVTENSNDIRSILMLWNASRRGSVVLPDPQFPLHGYNLGLGYESTSGDYKILKIRYLVDGRKEPGEIFALRSGSWRNIDKHHTGSCSQMCGMDSTLAFVNNAFHWIGYFEVSRTHSLVSFNISNEVYGEIPLPEQIPHL
ncbi:putative F-box protein At3g16210 [Lycium ferocissimum]|uniref:putative F-box protein At3g16210 n=1 Tax=Lycium ferocissimum TaxID=112874 RepID=UPI00281679F2|nr:putative F-box protein At3g16210 [Lycium ferocissimum]